MSRSILSLALASVAALASSAHAATITADGATCQLADAVVAANTDAPSAGCSAGSGADTILVTADAVMSIPRGATVRGAPAALPDIVGTLTIQGSPAGTQRALRRSASLGCIAGDVSAFRLINVGAGAALTLRNLKIADGCVSPPSGDALGGDIVVDGGALSLDGVEVSGGIVRAPAGYIARGGAIAYVNAQAGQIANSKLHDNVAIGGSVLTSQGRAGGADGGAIAVDGTAGSLLVLTSILRSNSAQGGKADYAGSACGGAIALRAGTLGVTASLLQANTAVGGPTDYTTPGQGRGGGICQTGGTLSVAATSIVGNSAQGGSGTGQLGDGDGLGGAVAHFGGNDRIDTSTLSGNLAQAGGGNTRGYGGGVYVGAAGLTLAHDTIATNTVQGGSIASGAGLWQYYDVNMYETILADNVGSADCVGGTPSLATSSGYNLIESRSACSTVATDKTNVDPQLQALADNNCIAARRLPDGTCAPTQAIGQSGSGTGAGFTLHPSPALDAGACTDAPGLTDARGVTRPQNIANVGDGTNDCDIGAYEALDRDGDGVTDNVDLCLGNDATGDADGDHVCANRDDNDNDPTIGVSLFANGFEVITTTWP